MTPAHPSLQKMREELRVGEEFLAKYNRPGPRYTSYPTAPVWNDAFGPDDLVKVHEEAECAKTPVSLYMHIPFCESLCLFCACNVVIEKNKAVSPPYLGILKREAERVSRSVSKSRPVVQFHWGGGTPTYLTPPQIEDLFGFTREHFHFAPDEEIGIEIDPRVTSREHLETLRKLGFNRLSMGIQDFHADVQKAIHRIQPFEMTRDLLFAARDLGFDSINVDLIYGLPYQTPDRFAHTVDQILELTPDRVALFSYAHVPWLKKQQGSFAAHLPEGMEKFEIFRVGLLKFLEAGADLYGMGITAISGFQNAYAQNHRDIPSWEKAVNARGIATMRGYHLSNEDRLRRAVINRLLCHTVVVKDEISREFSIDFDKYFEEELLRLEPFREDGLVLLDQGQIRATWLGRIFIRNLAMIFDPYLEKQQLIAKPLFSKTL